MVHPGNHSFHLQPRGAGFLDAHLPDQSSGPSGAAVPRRVLPVHRQVLIPPPRFPPPTQISTSSVLRVQLRLRSGDHSDGCSGRVYRQPFIATVAGQDAACGPSHLCSGPAGICPLLHHLHIHSIQQHRHCLCKTSKSSNTLLYLSLVKNA